MVQLSRLDFEEIDLRRFPCYKIAKDTLDAAPEQAIVLNAANEIAVAAFLQDKLAYCEIAELVDRGVNRFTATAATKSLDDVVNLDRDVRAYLSEL